jgi:diadenosine tetraphosphate (Ap4A) HIT family hydrolase
VADGFQPTAEEIADLSRLICTANRRVDQRLHPSGYSVGANARGDADQTIMHVHIDII